MPSPHLLPKSDSVGSRRDFIFANHTAYQAFCVAAVSAEVDVPTHFMVTAEFRWGACWRKRAQLKRPINVPPVLLAALSKPEQENDAAESLEWLWALRARDVEALFAILNRDAEAALVDRALEAATGCQ